MRRSLLASIISASLAVAAVPALVTPAGAAPGEGALDPSFSGDGTVITSITDSATGLAVARQSDGKIVVAGVTSTTGGVGKALFARYTRSGVLDTTFSSDGIATPAISDAVDGAIIRDVTLQPDGKIVGFGTANSGGGSIQKFLVVRLNPNGSLDTTFNGVGWRVTALETIDHADTGWGLVLQPDGKIVGTGQSRAGTAPGSPDYVGVVRYLANGKLDPTFSGDGIATVANGADAWGNKVTLQADGKIVIAAGTYPATFSDPDEMLVVRLNANGSPDTTFNGTGRWVSSFGTGERGAYDVLVQPDGRVLIGGQNRGATSDYDDVLVRFRANGSLDPTFGSAGIASANFTGSDWISSLALQPDGRIVAGGAVFDGSHSQAAVMRFNRDGSVDASFAGGSPFIASANTDSFEGIALGPDGKISAAGHTQDSSTSSILAARFIGDATAPYDGHLIGVPRYSTALTRTLSWNASDDNTGVVSFDVRYRSAAYNHSSYGGYTTFRSKTSLPYGTFKGSPGRTYCFSVRARDAAGNLGIYGDESCVEFPVDDRTATASAGWTKLTGSHFYRGTARSSTARGSTLKLPVRYRHLALVVTKCSGCGTVKVLLGSTVLATVKLAASHTRYQVVVPISSSITVRSGTLVVKQVSGGHRTMIDGVAVSLA